MQPMQFLMGKQIPSPADLAFFKFHLDNPGVYKKLVQLARRARSNGRTRAGIKMLWEVVRWEIFISTSGDEYKLNNNYHSRYARMIMILESDLEDFFHVRKLKS